MLVGVGGSYVWMYIGTSVKCMRVVCEWISYSVYIAIYIYNEFIKALLLERQLKCTCQQSCIVATGHYEIAQF